ncbi:MAG: T9SS type A sorting domain-containing protein [Sphingobacteriales bacterium]|nr:MAG: T9SS type A sorting domain-containing protein [Sphingobacteriales bacterium]
MFRIIIIFLFAQIVHAQEKYFIKSLGIDAFNSSALKTYYTTDSTLIIGGATQLTTESHIKSFLFFSDSEVSSFDKLNYGLEFGIFILQGLVITPFGYAFSGQINNDPYGTYPPTGYPFLMEVNHAGEVLNLYQFPDPPILSNGRALLYYPESNTYYFGGESATTASDPYRLMMTKITDGEMVWRRYYDNFTNKNKITDLQPASDGGCFLVGMVNHGNIMSSEGDVLFMRINNDGDILHSTINDWGGKKALANRFNSFNENNFIIAGTSYMDYYSGRVLLLRVDTLGNTIWDRHYQLGNGFNEASAVFQVGENIVCSGSSKRDGAKIEAFLMKVRGSDGEPLWVRYFDAEPNNDYFYNFTPAPDGGFLCVGRTEPVGSANMLVVKTNCMGLLSLPQADFTFVQDTTPPALFTFFNQSQYVYPDSIDGGHYIWEFGDGAVSNSTHPTHIYPEEGHYLVTLTAIVCSDTSVTQQLVYARSGSGIAVGIPDSSWEGSGGSSILVYPNPAQNTLTFALPEGLTPPSGGWGVEGDLGVSIYNLTGQMVLQTTLAAGETNKTISVAHLPVGMYLYVAEQAGSVLARGKVAVVR